MTGKLVIVFLLQSFAFFASAQNNIYFLNQTGRDVWVQKRTILEQGSYPYTLEAGRSGYQSVPLQISEPAILNMVVIPLKGPYGTADGIHYLLQPGDSLIVTLGKDQKPALAHASSRQRTKELSFIRKHMAKVGNILPYTLFGFNANTALNKKLWSSDLKNRDRLLDSLYRPYINSAESFASVNSIDSNIGRWYKNFYWGSMIADKLFVDHEITDATKKSLTVFYRDSLISWSRQADCTDCGNIPAYKNALQKIFMMRFEHLDEYQYLQATATHAPGGSRDFLLSRHLFNRMELTSDREKLLSHYNKFCSDGVYKKSVYDSYEFYAQQSKISADELATLIRPDKSEIGFTQLLAELKGQVIYIDFWASWCRPCVAEFPASHILKEKIKGQKIVMLYLSIDTDFNSWLKAREKHEVNDTYSFILASPEKNELVKKIALGPIPRYIIIDKQGNIVRLEAQRPSDPEILKTLLDIATSDR